MTEKDKAILEELAARDERRGKHKKIIRALLQQCADEGLTVKDVIEICEAAKTEALNKTFLCQPAQK